MDEKRRFDMVGAPAMANEKREGETYWHMSFLAFSMGLFLCIVCSLIFVTVVGNFAIISQTRGLLLKADVNDCEKCFTESTGQDGLPTWTTKSPELASSTDYKSSQSAETSSSTDSETSDDTTTTSSLTSPIVTEPDIKPKDPISILNEKKKGAVYTCTRICEHPPTIRSEVKLALSLKDANMNYIHLSDSVLTNVARIAKQRAAYVTLQFLYKDDLEKSITHPEWTLKVPKCDNPVNITISNCNK